MTHNGPSSRSSLALDAHVHVFDADTIEALRGVVASDGLTHFVAILDDLGLIERLGLTGACGLPFQWVHDWREPAIDPRAAGIKLHTREPLGSAETFCISSQCLAKVSALAGRMGRPILIHTDADQPATCSLPMLAELAGDHPDTTFIAAHAGVFPGPYFAESAGQEHPPGRWREVAAAALRENVQLLLDVGNLYADTVLFGADDPSCGDDPELRFDLFREVLAELTPAQRGELAGKLFVGTDFPCFWSPERPVGAYRAQADRMQSLFGEAFDEDRTARRLLALLPGEFS